MPRRPTEDDWAAVYAPAEPPITTMENTFHRWLGDAYDLESLHAVLAAAAVERLDGDPLWLMLVSGPGNAKTETVSALSGVGAVITSTISSEGALLSATPRKDAAGGNGGLLRRIGDRGLLVIKDVTSVLSMGRELRTAVLAALREVYDGRWERNVGTDGGRSLTWTGRLVLIGAVTTEWDSHHAVIAAMGDRFVLCRVDSTRGRRTSGGHALANVGHEDAMRAELADAVAALFADLDPDRAVLSDKHQAELLDLADLVTLGRTAIIRDQRGEPLEAHMPEAPTRFAKQLGQLIRGALALGMEKDDALTLARRCAADSLPPMRRRLLGHLLQCGSATVTDAMTALQVPRTTVDRALQELHLVGLVQRSGERWTYSIAADVDIDTLRKITCTDWTRSYPEKSVPKESKRREGPPLRPPTDISGCETEPAQLNLDTDTDPRSTR
jgi:hypothetical protein